MRHIAYLTGTYPRASDTFIQREVAAHREAGWSVTTFAIRRPDDVALASAAQEEERARTDYLLDDRAALLEDACRQLLTRPIATMRAIGVAVATHRPGIRGTVLQAVYFVEAAALAHRLRRQGISHLHNHFADSSCNVAMLSAAMGDHDFSFTLHGPAVLWEASCWSIGEKVRRSAFCACISNFARAQAASFAPDSMAKLEVVRCGVVPPDYRLRDHDGRGRVVVSVGRLDVVKGYTVLLQSVAQLRDDGIDVDLALIGDGPSRRLLEQQAVDLGVGDRVRFEGSRSPEDVAAMLHSADVFVLPSFAEGVPVSLMEAMASGVPVVATRVGGVGELVEDGRSGFVVDPTDATALADRIATLVADPDLRRSMGRAGRTVVEQRHDAAVEAERLRRCFDRSPDRPAARRRRR